MTPQELKNSILQLAVQGKLVEQRPEEGTAEELYGQIQAEKLKLIKAGTIKKEKPLPEIAEDEKPFDLPETWKWARLGDIYKLIMGQSPEGESVSESIYGIEFHQGKVFFGENYLQKSNQVTNKPTKIAEPYSVLLCVRAPVGIVNITEREICIGRGLCAISAYANMDAKYVLYSLRSCKTDFIKKATGTTFVAISGGIVKNELVPLPPLAEQKRIVAKIEELLPYIDRYEEAWSKLEDLNKRFPVDMQKSVLQTAIQGKLVEQRPEEGTGEELYQQIQAEKQCLIKAGTIKKQKPLPEITEDERPFDIPESWKWVRLGSIATKLTDGSHNPPPNTGVGYPVISAKNIKNGKIIFENVDRYTDEYGFQKENPRTNINKNDIIMGIIGGSIGNVAVYTHEKKVIAQRSIAIIKTLVDTQYVVVLLRSPLIQNCLQAAASGSAQGGVYLGTLGSLIIPLPPLAEQQRIVAKLEEILPLCEKLK